MRSTYVLIRIVSLHGSLIALTHTLVNDLIPFFFGDVFAFFIVCVFVHVLCAESHGFLIALAHTLVGDFAPLFLGHFYFGFNGIFSFLLFSCLQSGLLDCCFFFLWLSCYQNAICIIFRLCGCLMILSFGFDSFLCILLVYACLCSGLLCLCFLIRSFCRSLICFCVSCFFIGGDVFRILPGSNILRFGSLIGCILLSCDYVIRKHVLCDMI